MNEREAYNVLNILHLGDIFNMHKLRKRFSTWTEAWHILGKKSKLDPEAEWEKLENKGVDLILAGEPNFPAILNEIPNPPLALYLKGAPFDELPKLAIIGTRRATLNGKGIARSFACSVAASGITVVSGLALGIDAAAHEGALEVKGKTIAVLANGLGTIYPRQNAALAARILKSGGTLVSEYSLVGETLPYRFLERNRIVSGLSLGVVVVEAPEGSGALATANCAVEQNREVFVVPGPLNNANYSGSHNLLRAGARLVTRPEEVLDDLNMPAKTVESISRLSIDGLNEEQKQILTALEKAGEPISVDKISELTKMDVSAISRNLTFLLIQSIVKEEGGKYYL